MNSIIAYLRVSKERQGRSGLGLEAQRNQIQRYAADNNYQIAEEFVEVETGKGFDALDRRPLLKAALHEADRLKCSVVVAKLDRLSRNVAFIASLMDNNVPFIVVSLPDAKPFMLHVYAAIAEEERRMIAQRTKDALAAAKRRGVRLGSKTIAARNREGADRHAEGLRRDLMPMVVAGRSCRAIAADLNRRGIVTMRGGQWHAITVHRLVQRLDASNNSQVECSRLVRIHLQSDGPARR